MKAIEKFSSKNIILNLALIFFSLLLSLSLIEVALRQTAYDSVLTHYKYPKGYYINKPGYGYDITPGFPKAYHVLTDLSYPIWSNSLGCFDREYKNEAPFIYLAGDSFAWGYAPFEKKFGTLIESLLTTRVLKCGVSGFGPKQELFKIRSILKKIETRPKLIIAAYFVGNDFEDDYTFPNYAVHEGYRVQVRYLNRSTGEIKVKDNLKERYRYFSRYCSPKKPKNPVLDRAVCLLRRNSIIFNLLKGQIRRLQRRYLSGNSPKVREKREELQISNDWRLRAYPDHFINLKSFNDFAKKIGSGFLVVVVPEKEQIYPFLKSSTDGTVEKQVRLLKSFMVNRGIDYFDLTPVFKKYADKTSPDALVSGMDLYLANDHHWTAKGDYLAGLMITRYILEKKLLDVPEGQRIRAHISEKIYKEFVN